MPVEYLRPPSLTRRSSNAKPSNLQYLTNYAFRKITEAVEDDQCERDDKSLVPTTPQDKLSCLKHLGGRLATRLRLLFCPRSKEVHFMDVAGLKRYARALRHVPVSRPVQIATEGKKLLVMSLDGLLVRTGACVNTRDFCIRPSRKPIWVNLGNSTLKNAGVTKRFGVEYFLKEMAKYYSLVIYDAN